MAAIDISTAVAEFLADPEQTSLELPHMTTGERKSTKKLLEQYPELRCESFGFGAERQLHLFKKSAADVQQEKQGSSELGLASPEPSTAASSEGPSTPQKGSPWRGSLAASERDPSFPMMHEDLQVRNTFIHIDERAPMDERAVQSMPHGMFRQCIARETSERATGHSNPTTSPQPCTDKIASAANENQAQENLPLSPGALVMVEGLLKAPAFNGRSAVVQGFDESTGRYDILLASSDGCQQAKIKGENLRVVLPCP